MWFIPLWVIWRTDRQTDKHVKHNLPSVEVSPLVRLEVQPPTTQTVPAADGIGCRLWQVVLHYYSSWWPVSCHLNPTHLPLSAQHTAHTACQSQLALSADCRTACVRHFSSRRWRRRQQWQASGWRRSVSSSLPPISVHNICSIIIKWNKVQLLHVKI